ncbi:MAG: beta-ketoacyl-[acyl-carrier-protein] synthase family protein [Zoogloeaceae bacterium]|jgi:3-oxoacyl-[acyl-carrier-protein] synthase II|nr:beta-ketoacyl-[acyl-carrier-protein] synthase family protein [Zoogloeaceae bacterium]
MRRVAITGFGVVSPIGVGREAFFAGLESGKNGIAPITRFDASGLDVRCAGEVQDVPEPADEPDRDLFWRDPKVVFALTAAEEALAMAGVDSFSADDLIHIGSSLETFCFRDFSLNGHPGEEALLRRLIATYRGCLPLDTAISRIRARYGNPGQAVTNCSACAVGAQTIGQAFHAIRDGRFTRAMTGGFDSMINLLGVGGFQLLGALATGEPGNGATLCLPFDANRTGLVLGEGAAFVVLEEREQALAVGKTLYAEIVGFGSTLDACGLSAPDPTGDGAVRAMRAALADAGLPSQAVDHINTHGTGTQLNDPVEAQAIRRVFADTWERIPVTAVKSMIGHSIAAAGAIEVVACLYTLLRSRIPPNIGLQKVGAGCELNHVAGTARPFAARYVLTNSFGFGGQNASLILTQADT